MKNHKFLSRLFSAVGVLIVLLSCVVPVFASEGSVPVSYETCLPIDTAMVYYPGNGKYVFSSLGMERIGGFAADYTGDLGTIYIETDYGQITNNQYIYASGIVTQTLKFMYASQVDFYASKFVCDDWSAFKDITVSTYGGQLNVNVTYLVYNQATNKFVSKTASTSRSHTTDTSQTLYLFDGMDLQSGMGDYVIIEDLKITFTPLSSTITFMFNRVPYGCNLSFADVVNSNVGRVVVDSENGNAADLFSWLIKPIDAFLGIEIMPGVSLGGIFMVALGLILVLVLLMYFGG